MNADERPDWPHRELIQRYALLAGAGGLLLCALGFFLDPEQFFESYLVAFNLVLALALGSLAIWMVHNLTGGFWGLVIQRWLEAASRTLPLVAVFFLPLLLGLNYLYPWTNPEGMHLPDDLHHHLKHKLAYLNVPFFVTRAVSYFAVWLVLMWIFNFWSAAQDRDPSSQRQRRLEALSGPGLVLYGLTMTFAAVDWVMSLEPLWYSTIFAAIIATGQLLPALALAVAGLAWLLPHNKSLAGVMTPQIWNDLGNMLLAFVMLWTYMSFSQLILIWSGNLKEEIPWYLIRSDGGWQWVGVLLAVFYFGLPFVLLMSRGVTRRPQRLARVAVALVVMSFVHQFWLVAPEFSHHHLAVHWLDLAALVGLVGIWAAVFLWQLRARPLLPVHDPLLREALHHA
jgi:hypothetical protein